MVHLFKQSGYRIALDTASGGVHLLTEIAYDILSRIEPPMEEEMPGEIRYALAKYSSEDLKEAYGELYQLYKDGTLFSEDALQTLPVRKDIVVKSMCLHISHDCNMRCRYCFADAGDYYGKRKLMSYECGCKAIDFLLEKSGKIRNLELDFFGGEPLMNFDTVKALVRYGREREKEYGKNIRFTITTNGTLLDDDAIDFINKNMSNAVLSVDGRKSVNDGMRTYLDGSGTYDDIIPAFKKLVKDRDADWYVRGTFTRENLDFAKDVLSLRDEGFENISVEPVVLSKDSPLAIREEDIPRIFEEYDTLVDEMIRYRREGKGFTFFHFMIDLDQGPCVYKRCKGCGSGSEYVSVTPDGDIFPCHQFVEYTDMKMGNVFDGTFNTELQQLFATNSILTNPTCKDCFAKYFCGGGCAANNRGQMGDMKIPYDIGCKLERKRVECAIALKASEIEDNE